MEFDRFYKQTCGEVFPIVGRLVAAEHARRLRLIMAGEIAVLLMQDTGASAILEAARRQHPDRSLEQIAYDFVEWFGKCINAGDSEWGRDFECLRIDNQWAFRTKPVTVPSS